MKKVICAALLAMCACLCGCTAGEAKAPAPTETENTTVTVTIGGQSFHGHYTGWMLDKRPEGEGEFTADEGFTFTGRFAAGEARTGQAEDLPLSLVWDDIPYTGAYSGELTADLAHGQGVFRGKSATGLSLALEGRWKRGVLGKGNAQADLYTTLWQGRERPGQYEGQIQNGLPQGKGTFCSRDDVGEFTYTGQWEDGVFHGTGTLAYDGNANYVRQGTFTKGGFTPSYFEALNTVGSYEPRFTVTAEQQAFLEQFPGLWDEEDDRRNYLKSEYSKILNYRLYHYQIFRSPEKFENTWMRLNSFRLIDRREVTFDNGMTIHTLTAVDPTYSYTFQCYLVGEIPEDLRQRSHLDMYATPLGLSEYTNSLGQSVPCAIVLVGDIRIR